MKNNRFLRMPGLIVLLLVLLLGGCTFNPGKLISGRNARIELAESKLIRIANPQVQKSDQQELSAGNRAFAVALYQKLRDQDGNLFFSPYSISLALAMTYGGASEETARQMADVMHFTLPPDRLHPAFNALDQYLASLGQPSSTSEPTPTEKSAQDFQFNIANSTWGQKGFSFLPAYLDLLAQNYGAGLRLVDFAGAPEASRQAINDWVSQETQEKIKDLFPPGTIDGRTRLALVNAIYFKASWMSVFNDANTKEDVFYLKDGGQVRVPMMVSSYSATRYERGDDFQAVGLPYAGGKTILVVVMPDEEKFDSFETGLDAAKLEAILDGLNWADLELTLPKFKIESSFSLAETLAEMGMPDAFDINKADFSGMDGKRDLYISQVVHKAYVAVDEKGTEAAAASGVIMVPVSKRMSPPPVVKVDRPFLFFIYEQESETVLFAGRVMNPGK